jgi:predicted component of type VI protein secretion system
MDGGAFARHNPAVKLVVEKGPETGREFRVDGETIIGRQAGCGIVVADTKVSREHARVFVEAGAAYVADLGSSNGTFVNGTKLAAPRRLAAGDRLAVGETTFRFHADPAPAPIVADRPRPAGTAPRPRPTAPSSPGDVTVRRRILQYSPEKDRPNDGVLIQDLEQRSALFRTILWVIGIAAAAAVAGGIAWVIATAK